MDFVEILSIVVCQQNIDNLGEMNNNNKAINY